MTDDRKRRTRVDDALDDILAGDPRRDEPAETKRRARRQAPATDTPPPSSTPADAGRMVPVRLRAGGRFAVLASGERVRRTVYVAPDRWLAVLELAAIHGCSASDVVDVALAVYLDRHAGEGLDRDA